MVLGNISLDQKLAWNPDVVFFQENTWMNTKVCLERTEKCFKKFVTNEKLERKVVKKPSAVVWYGLLNSRKLWQLLDAGYG